MAIDLFPAVRYRLEFEVEQPIQLPEYAGSTLRGIFGAALRRLSCLTREPSCHGCGLARSCPYSVIFEAPPPPDGHVVQDFAAIPNPYIIEPPTWGQRYYRTGETLLFHMVLVGRARAQLALIVLAWQQAMERRVGAGEGKAKLLRVLVQQPDGLFQPVFDQGEGVLLEHDDTTPWPQVVGTEQMTLHLTTPLRINRRGAPLGVGQLTPRDFLMALLRRVSLLAEFHAGLDLGFDFAVLSQAATQLTAAGSLQWRDWKRWSSRQEQEMMLGGLVGSWTLHGALHPFQAALALGQWLHVGKNTTFGLGQYRLEAA
ncbi:MAG: CRISPR system precrRNA processing endoribonuclease RAMP protein Cas6 [Magnetococcales bacterium]|nr:CRISPR system precrRNA processing endoribonuclease RAMP protein Cas6 [Magnetococcales bacterium]